MAVAAIRETIVSLGLIAVTAPTILASLLARRLLSDSELSFKEDLQRSFTRGLSILPLGTIKRYLEQPPIDSLLNSPRFSALRSQLCIPVSNNLCKGTWICGGASQDPKPDPEETNRIVLLWLHGGAYHFRHPLGSAATLLRVSEIVESKGFALSIFSLQYTLAPEGKFPTQQNEAVSAYQYLLSLGFDPQRIIIAGESAGGHLAISCSLGLAEADIPKPRGALLLFPWVKLEHYSPSFKTNKHKDALNKRLLDRCVEAVGARDGETGAEGKLGLVDFTKPGPFNGDKNWKDILPAKTWVNVGSHDVFLHDIETFVASAEADGADIELQVTPRMGHGWQLGLDRATEKEYCSLGSGQDVPKGIMRGSENFAEGLVKLLM
ncbi:Alpha/Beta hydrolase protein [Aspergillus granulosus]|uniref:Alpha/Beta hydrolase protein n=1 Tax=Aspergillus granulosus TaxID=176169 RepID=A0ABR4H1C2_9EURO